MEWLEAALAFAVIMIVFSTMVTAIIEILHRILRLREKGLQDMMQTVYKNVIQPRLSQQLDLQGTTARDFIEKMTRTRFQPVNNKSNSSNSNTRKLKSLTTLEFVERLAETSVGQSIISNAIRRGKNHAEDFLKDLASKYEDIGQSASDYFSRRAQVASMGVAIALAFSLNINAIHLFQTLLTNEDVRKAWIEQGDAVAQQAKQQQERLGKLLAESPNTGNTSAQAIQQAVDKNINQLNETAASLHDSGIPIGWGSAPWKSGSWKQAGLLNGSWMLLQWLAAVLLAGLLIGLGGPFWFDTFRKLSALTGIVRGLQTPVQKIKEPGQPQKEATTAQRNSEFVQIFQIAAKGHALGSFRGRMLLTPQGTVDRGGVL